MRRKVTFFLTASFLMTVAASANAQALYEYLQTPNNVAFIGTPFAEVVVPGEFEDDPSVTYSGYAWPAIDTAVDAGEPGTATFGDNANYWDWPENTSAARPNGVYSLQVLWDTAYDLTTLNAYVTSGDTVGFTDADRIVSYVDFYVNYEPVGATPAYSWVGGMVPGATDDVAGFDLVSLSGTWNGVTSVRYDFTQPTPDPGQAPRIAEVQAIAPGVVVDYSPVILNGLTLVGEGGYDQADNLASDSIAFSSPTLTEPGYTGDDWSPDYVKDGLYSATDWIGLTASPTLGKGFVGLNLGDTAQEIGMVAFSENNLTGAWQGGRRTLGEYEIQYTTVSNPDETTPDSAWTTIGTADYVRAANEGDVQFGDFQDPGKRHIFSFDSVMATGIRLIVPRVWDEDATAMELFPNVGYSSTATAIDELEVYAPGKVFDVDYLPSLKGIAYNTNGVTLVEEGGTQTSANLALASKGGVVFSSGTLGDQNGWGGVSHTNAGANDGVYGNGSSWIGSAADWASYNPSDEGLPFIGVALTEATKVGSIAIGRNNSETLDYYLDRWAGEYTLQYTNVANPDADTPDTDWITIGTLEYLMNLEASGLTDFEDAEFYAAYKRHLFEFDSVTATALRLLVPSTGWNGTCIDEFEIYAASSPQIPGDANKDGKVDGSDVTILAGNWQTLTGASWDMGDFNGDGKVDGSDVTILAGNWQAGVGTSAASVPEPSTIVLLFGVLAGLAILRRVKK